MSEAVLNSISYFTNGISLPDNGTYGPSQFSNGLLLPEVGGLIPGKGTMDTDGQARDRFVRQAKDEAEMMLILMLTVAAINDED